MFKKEWAAKTLVVGILFVLNLLHSQNVRCQQSGSKMGEAQFFMKDSLSNGLTYYLARCDTNQQKISIQVMLKAGHNREEADQLQFAHLVEHLGFARTKHFFDVKSFLVRNGLQMGLDFNARTGNRYVKYWVNIPSANKGLLDSCLLLASDWCQGIVLDSVSIEKERTTLLNEIGLPGDSTVRQLHLATSPDGKWESLYRQQMNIVTFPQSALRKFYEKWYQPNLTSVMILGDIKLDEMAADISKKFGGISNTQEVTGAGSDKFEALKGEWFFNEVASKAPNELNFYYRQRKIFDSETQRRLERIAVGKLYNLLIAHRLEQMALKLNVGLEELPKSRFYINEGVDFLTAALDFWFNMDRHDAGSIESDLKELIRFKEQIRRYGFSTDEIQESIKELRTQTKWNTDAVLIYYDKAFEQNFLNSLPILSPGEYEAGLNRSLDMEASIVNREIKDWFDADNPTVYIQVRKDVRNRLPEKGSFVNSIKKVSQEPIPKFQPANFTVPATLFDDQELKVQARAFGVSDHEKIGSSVVIYQSGLRIILKKMPMEDADKKIYLWGFRNDGSFRYHGSEYYSARTAPLFLLRSGVGKWNGNQVKEIMRSKHVSLTPFVADNMTGWYGKTDSANLKTMMKLLYLFMSKPKFDPLFAGNVRKEFLKQVKPKVDGQTEVTSKYSGDRAFPPAGSEWIDSVDIVKAEETYHQLFSAANTFTFYFAGNFNPDSVLNVVSPYLNALPVVEKAEKSVEFPPTPVNKEGYHEVIEQDGVNSEVTLMSFAEADNSIKHIVAREVLRNALYQRLTHVLRTELGAVYGVSVINAALVSKVDYFGVHFKTQHKDLSSLIDHVKKEVSVIKANALDQVSFSAAIMATREGFKERMGDWTRWRDHFILQRIHKSSYDDIANWELVLESLTAGDIRDCAARYLIFE